MKKFYDVFPPGLKKEAFSERKKPKKSSTFSLKLFFLVLIIFIILGGFFASFRFSTLDLEIWPEIETITKEEKISARLDAEEIDFLNKIILASLFEKEKEIWQEFSATGREFQEEKAKGEIRIFNKSSKALSLVKETRFLSEGDKIFISPKSIFVPGNSHVDTKVVAIEAGEDYNIDPSNFSVPGLKGTNRYFTTNGQSFESMKEGSKEEIKKVTQQDLENAEDSLTEKVFLSLQNSLKEKSSPQFILFDEVVSKEIADVFSPVKAGAEIEKFGFSVKGKAKAVVFKKSDLENFLKELFFLEINSDKKVFSESLSIDYELESVNFEDNQIEINTKVSAKVYQALDEESIKNGILKVGESQIKEIILQNFTNISKIEMKFYPFWVKRAPIDPEKIKIYWKES